MERRIATVEHGPNASGIGEPGFPRAPSRERPNTSWLKSIVPNPALKILALVSFCFSTLLFAAEAPPPPQPLSIKCLLLATLKTIVQNPIERFAQPRENHELIEAGTILSRQNELQPLPDGYYLYLIDSDGHVIYSARTPDLTRHPEELHLATHRALERRLSVRFDKEPKILAAGEFEIHYGRVSSVNNRAGTYRGGRPHLDFAVTSLHHFGLQLEPGTHQEDFSQGPHKELHTNNILQSRWLLLFKDTAEYKRLLELDRALSQKHPHPTLPGYFNGDLLKAKVLQKQRDLVQQLKSKGVKSPYTESLEIAELSELFFILKYLQAEGPGFLVNYFKKKKNPNSFNLENILRHIQDL